MGVGDFSPFSAFGGMVRDPHRFEERELGELRKTWLMLLKFESLLLLPVLPALQQNGQYQEKVLKVSQSVPCLPPMSCPPPRVSGPESCECSLLKAPPGINKQFIPHSFLEEMPLPKTKSKMQNVLAGKSWEPSTAWNASYVFPSFCPAPFSAKNFSSCIWGMVQNAETGILAPVPKVQNPRTSHRRQSRTAVSRKQPQSA